MKKIFLAIIVFIVLVASIFMLTGCSMTVETTDNTVSASVDGETTEKVDGVLDWIKERLNRLFE